MTDAHPQTQVLTVNGMTCAACTGRVERMVSRVKGAGLVSANLMTAQVTLGRAADPGAVAQVLTKAGFEAGTKRTRISIDAMSCASCVSRVEAALTALPGVIEARVNLADESAELHHYEINGLAERASETVTRLGYPARLALSADRAERAHARDAQQAGLWRAFVIAAMLTLPVFIAEMGGHLVPAFHHWLHGLIGVQVLWIAQFVLTTLVLFGPGWRFFRAGVPALIHRAPDMNSLVVLGAGAAWGFSTLVTFWPGLIPAASRAVYFEASAVIVTLILLGRWLEARAKGQTGAAIARLVGLQPQTAQVERDGQISELPIAQIAVGDLLHLRPGERVAVDGILETGQGWLDESMLTGEPLPVEKTPGDTLIAGTVNGTRHLTYHAARIGADTVLARIVAMVEQAQGAKLPIQALVDRVTRIFVPAVLVIAALTGCIWALIGPEPVLANALVAVVSVLIIACPCAMGLATPVSIMVGTGRAAELGVLFRQGDALQGLQEVTLVAFDKTGTLTQGRPEVTAIQCAEGVDEAQVWALAGAVEIGSEHPIAHAILQAATARGVTLAPAEATEAMAGFGVKARVNGEWVVLGTERLMRREGIETGALAELADDHAKAGRSPVFVAAGGRALAVLIVADQLRPHAVQTVADLHARGLETAMITGDTPAAAQAVAAELGITWVVAGVLPEGKLSAVQDMQRDGQKVAFVGDGINDAPVMAAADVGLAVGTGTDIAVEAAQAVLMTGDPRLVVTGIDLSHRVMRNIRQNLFWAFAYNIVLIPVAAGVLFPHFGITLSPMLGAAAMALSSVFVVSNALRLRR